MGHKSLLLPVLLLFTIFLCQLSGCTKEKTRFHIGVLQWSEQVRPYALTYQGIIDSLSNKGYREGFNLTVSYTNVEQDKTLATQTAEAFVKRGVDLIVALGTGSSLAALEATRDQRIPIVYSIAGAPEASGILVDQHTPEQNITGVSMLIPVAEQFQTLQELLPQLKKIGILYCTEMVQAIATGEEATAAARTFGWLPLAHAVSKDELQFLQDRVRALAAKVDAIYIPTDPILGTPEHLETIVTAADAFGIPVIGVAENFVEEGALLAVHCDFYDIGRQTGEPIVQLLQGVDIRKIKPQNPIIKRVSINLGKANSLRIKIKRNVIQRADNIIY
jgi:putative ABC transport system substrate-binding protein